MADVINDELIFSDRSGNTIKFFNYKGMPFPTLPGDMVTRMKTVKDLRTRPDDVFICGYPKSGTNWVWEIVNMILSGKPENVNRNKMSMMLECKDEDELESRPSPRILNTHLLLPDLPTDIHKSRIIYLLRNPKDVCVSHFHHNIGLKNMYGYDGDWENYFHLWLDGKGNINELYAWNGGHVVLDMLRMPPLPGDSGASIQICSARAYQLSMAADFTKSDPNQPMRRVHSTHIVHWETSSSRGFPPPLKKSSIFSHRLVDCGCFFKYVKHWERELKKHPNLNIHILQYENLKLDFLSETKRLSQFLGVIRPENFYKSLEGICHIEQMKDFKNKCYTEEEHNFWRDKKSNFFRKGIIGDWKNLFTVEQNQKFDALCQERLNDSQLKFVFEA